MSSLTLKVLIDSTYSVCETFNFKKNKSPIVEVFVAKACISNGADYLPQATASKIMKKWGIAVKMTKTSRHVDFAIRKSRKLYFVETNFYGGGGSKLKSTAGEYITMNRYWNKQGITFLWVTDGHGWINAQRPLREYFHQADYLLNLEMLQKGYLSKIIEKF
jgi:type II restriction enzyme